VWVLFFWIIFVSSLRNYLCEIYFVMFFFGIRFVSNLNIFCFCELYLRVLLWIIFVIYLLLFLNYLCGFSYEFALWVLFSACFLELSLWVLMNSICDLYFILIWIIFVGYLMNYLWVSFLVCLLNYLCEFSYE